ncbi:MAG: SpoIIE family protein phosphatase [Desulfovibrionaceae bacterium]|nr:SpoIIE family protein phosphatase [Desulfovibrionaceae bacterium]MBF0512818.1 SpoIIE family protein phosphatase [Desulfovibrionaceae bacterium]
MPNADCRLVTRALSGLPDECGDAGVIVDSGGQCFLALIDVLGHGPQAHEVALAAVEFLKQNSMMELTDLMSALHGRLKGTRGAVVTLGRFDRETGALGLVGVGNITARLFGGEAVRLLGRDGIVGYSMPTPRRLDLTMFPGDVLMLYSDGVREHFELFDRPGLLLGNAAAIAGEVLAHFGKGDDDASCLILRCTP